MRVLSAFALLVMVAACANARSDGTGDGDDAPGPVLDGGDGDDDSGSGSDGGSSVTCSAPQAPANGTVTAPTTNVGDVATYSCNNGFVISGSATATCQANGAWTQAPTCVAALACGAPPGMTNGSVNAPTLSSGSTATYSCGGNFIMLKGQYSVCNNGTWVGATPQCATRLGCVCSGEFVQGEAIYAPFANAGMTSGLAAGTPGTVLAGNSSQAPTFALLVQWNGWSEGHNGRCQVAACGACSESGSSKWYQSCTSVATPRLRCTCGGAFTEGDRVVALTSAPSGIPGVTLGQAGTVVAGAPGQILVQWDGFTGGHDGMCGTATCGRCTPSGVARSWVTCAELGRAP